MFVLRTAITWGVFGCFIVAGGAVRTDTLSRSIERAASPFDSTHAPAQTQFPADNSDAPAITAWLKKTAIPVDIADGGTWAAYAGLQVLFQGISVVGVGEATHGTHEFVQFKQRLLEFLVTKMGFTAFAVEAPYSLCTKINEYVLGGTEDLAALKTGWWTADTEETDRIIEWMRKYNSLTPGKKIQYYGIDSDSKIPLEAISAYLKTVSPQSDQKLEPLRSVFGQPRRLSPEERPQVCGRLQEIADLLVARNGAFEVTTAPSAVDEAARGVHLLEQAANCYAPRELSDEEARDYYMAENVEEILRKQGPGGGVVVSAHNGHVTFHRMLMGYYLKRALGDSYYALGAAFDQGSFRAYDMTTHGPIEYKVGSAPEGSLDWYLGRTAIPSFLVDLRRAEEEDTSRRFMKKTLPMRSIGALYSPDEPEDSLFVSSLEKNYDGMVFFAKTTPTRPK
jgi:erythromycin esterase